MSTQREPDASGKAAGTGFNHKPHLDVSEKHAEELQASIAARQAKIQRIQARLQQAAIAERIEKDWRRGQGVRAGAVALGIVVLLAGTAWAWPDATPTGRFGHEHYVFRLFIGGEEVSFDHPYFDFDRTRNVRSHLHLSGPESTSMQYVIHAEGELPISLGMFFSSISVLMKQDRIILDQGYHEGRSVANNATHNWQLWTDGCGDRDPAWTRHEGGIRDYQPQQFDRLLIAYAPRTANVTSLASLFQKVPTHLELQLGFGEVCEKTADVSPHPH